MLHAEVEAMQAAPDDEGPVGAVPEPPQQHGQHQVAVTVELAVAVTTQGDVEIVAQKARQGDVPAGPELADIGRLVRGVEVEGDLKAQHARHADGHIGVAGEIEIELEAVGQDADPGGQELRVIPAQAGIDHRDQVVGDQELLGQAEGEKAEAHRQVFGAEGIVPPVGELGQQVLVIQHRPGDDVREVGGEQGVAPEANVRRPAMAGIDQEGDLGEGEKGDADGQEHVQRVETGPSEVVDRADKEIGVLEIAQEQQVAGDGEDQPEPFMRLRHLLDPLVSQVVTDDGDRQDGQIGRIPGDVKGQGGQQ